MICKAADILMKHRLSRSSRCVGRWLGPLLARSRAIADAIRRRFPVWAHVSLSLSPSLFVSVPVCVSVPVAPWRAPGPGSRPSGTRARRAAEACARRAAFRVPALDATRRPGEGQKWPRRVQGVACREEHGCRALRQSHETRMGCGHPHGLPDLEVRRPHPLLRPHGLRLSKGPSRKDHRRPDETCESVGSLIRRAHASRQKPEKDECSRRPLPLAIVRVRLAGPVPVATVCVHAAYKLCSCLFLRVPQDMHPNRLVCASVAPPTVPSARRGALVVRQGDGSFSAKVRDARLQLSPARPRHSIPCTKLRTHARRAVGASMLAVAP